MHRGPHLCSEAWAGELPAFNEALQGEAKAQAAGAEKVLGFSRLLQGFCKGFLRGCKGGVLPGVRKEGSGRAIV